MDDKELLVLAAKSIGYCNPTWDDDIWDDEINGIHVQWNPLLDDGDALRLAATLKMGIDIGNGYVESTWYDMDISETHETMLYYDYDEDRLPTLPKQ